MYYFKVGMVTLITIVVWSTIVVAGALFGWWRQPLATTDDAPAFMRSAIKMIDQGNRGNTALLLIEDGAISAEYYSTSADSVDRDTVFATASMSKWITAWGVMRLVEDGKLDLDRPVDDYLTRWHLPPSQFDNHKVTTRRLQSHTAGLVDGLGFGDYLSGEQLPTLEQSLANPKSYTGEPVAIAVGMEPGSKWQYSGGGYLLLELLVEEVSGEPFETYMSRSLFHPLGMTRSGYFDLSQVENSAKSYDQDGKPAATYMYASNAATGFNTSASDMAKFVMAQLSVVKDKPLSQATIDAMRQAHAKSQGIEIWGLGTMLYAPTATGNFVFGHDGANEPAINASVRVNPDTRDGIVVLETGNRALASQVASEWVFWQTGLPDFLSIPGEIRRTVPVLIGGACVILLAAVFIARRRQVASSPKMNL